MSDAITSLIEAESFHAAKVSFTVNQAGRLRCRDILSQQQPVAVGLSTPRI